MERIKFQCSLTELRGIMLDWVKILHLEDWNIQLDICDKKEMTDEYGQINAGFVEQLPVSLQAKIKIINPKCYEQVQQSQLWFFPQNMEETLVHELLHLEYEPFKPRDEDSGEYLMWHRQLDKTAKLLVQFKQEIQQLKHQ